MPASIAASGGVRTFAQGSFPARAAAGVLLPEVGAGGRLDAVGALAEVDGVEVLGEDLVLGPLALEVVGERGLAELLEDGSRALRLERVLDELLGDRRGALGGPAGQDVGQAGSGHALDVDAVVLVEAAVLDRDGGLLHVGRDLIGVVQDALVVVQQRPDLVALIVEDDRVLGLGELLLVLELRQVLRDRHHHPEEGRDDREQAEAGQDDQQAKLLDAAGLRLAGTPRADPAGQARGRRLAVASGAYRGAPAAGWRGRARGAPERGRGCPRSARRRPGGGSRRRRPPRS